MSVTPKRMWPTVKAMLHSALRSTRRILGGGDRLLAYSAEKLPTVAELENARADSLPLTKFPKDIWTQVWSNNPAGYSAPSRGGR